MCKVVNVCRIVIASSSSEGDAGGVEDATGSNFVVDPILVAQPTLQKKKWYGKDAKAQALNYLIVKFTIFPPFDRVG